jgi:hypothetical protein
MGELKIIIWVILGIIYLVSRLRKKEPAAPPKPMDENPTEQPMTFEELLREIQTGKQAKEVKPVPEPVAPYTNYDDEVKSMSPLRKQTTPTGIKIPFTRRTRRQSRRRSIAHRWKRH